MAARRMPHGDHSTEVERISLRKRSQMIGRARYIFKSARPSSSLIAHAAVFNVPGRDAGFGERRAQMAHIRQAVLRHPTSAVNDDGDRAPTRALGQSQLAELKFVRTVRDAGVGRRGRTSQDTAGRLLLFRADKGEQRDRSQCELDDDKKSGSTSYHQLFEPFKRRVICQESLSALRRVELKRPRRANVT